MLAVIAGVIAVAVSGFSLGYSLAMYFTSSYYLRTQVEKRLEEAVSRRCAQCHAHSAAMDKAREHSDTANDAMDR